MISNQCGTFLLRATSFRTFIHAVSSRMEHLMPSLPRTSIYLKFPTRRPLLAICCALELMTCCAQHAARTAVADTPPPSLTPNLSITNTTHLMPTGRPLQPSGGIICTILTIAGLRRNGKSRRLSAPAILSSATAALISLRSSSFSLTAPSGPHTTSTDPIRASEMTRSPT